MKHGVDKVTSLTPDGHSIYYQDASHDFDDREICNLTNTHIKAEIDIMVWKSYFCRI